MNRQPRWRRCSGIVHEVLVDAVVTFAPSSREVRRLDVSTSRVYLALVSPANADELATMLQNDAAIPMISREDVLRLLRSLETWALIEQIL